MPKGANVRIQFRAYKGVDDRPMEQRYLSVAQAAAYMGLSPKTLYAWAEKGAIPAHKLGRLWRFDKAELGAFVRDQTYCGFA